MSNTKPSPGQKITSFADLGATSGALEIQAGAVSAAVKASQGTFTANGATQVDVVDTRITANSIILTTIKTAAGTPSPNAPNVISKTAGVGFSIKATASDTSLYSYVILG